MCVEKSSSVALAARWSTITWLRANGAMVATYWSVFVTVRMAQMEITEMGMRRAVNTTRTHAVIRLVRRARGGFLPCPGAAAAPASGSPGICSDSISFIWAFPSFNA